MINIEYLRQRLDYDPSTGHLAWKHCDAMPSWWNARYAGKSAFTAPDKDGYGKGQIAGRRYFAHRIAFAIFHGHWPTETIDHINGKKLDNRIINLREASRSQNQSNRPKQKNNTSGFKGVTRHRDGWMAKIKLNGKTHYVGTFKTPEEASAAYAAAAKTIHGDFARVEA